MTLTIHGTKNSSCKIITQLGGPTHESQEDHNRIRLFHDDIILLTLRQKINTEFKFTMELFHEQMI